MTFTVDDSWILVTLSVIALSCALIGSFLLLNRLTLLGDAISHAVLPGLPLAYMITGSRNSLVMLVGALISGALASFSTSWVEKITKISPEAALGLVFTTFFSVGVILLNAVASQIDLDLDCVLYGAAEHIPFITHSLLGYELPRAFLLALPTLFFVLIFIMLFYKELLILAFDTNSARTQGVPDFWLKAWFLLLATLVIVIAFEALGSITVVALLAAPSAAGYLLSKRVSGVIIWSVFFSLLSVWLGYTAALTFDTSIGGAVGTVAGLLWFITFIFSPHHGLLKNYLTNSSVKLTIIREDILGTLYRYKENPARDALTFEKLHNNIPNKLLLCYSLCELWLLKEINLKNLTLTQKGEKRGASIVRAHRLFELYLLKNTALPLDHLHAPSERMEHFIPEDALKELLREFPELTDPHGKPIPRGS